MHTGPTVTAGHSIAGRQFSNSLRYVVRFPTIAAALFRHAGRREAAACSLYGGCPRLIDRKVGTNEQLAFLIGLARITQDDLREVRNRTETDSNAPGRRR